VSFREIIDKLKYDGIELPTDEAEEKETTDEASAEQVEGDGSDQEVEEAVVESTDKAESKDTVVDGSEDEQETVGDKEDGSKVSPEPGEAEVLDEESEGVPDPIVIGDKEYTESELEQGLLRQSDYTRKTQELAAQRKALTEEKAEQERLTDAILSDAHLKEFLKAHPEAFPTLLRTPDETKTLLGNADAVQKIWDQADLLEEHPEIAERLASTSDGVTAQAELDQQMVFDNSMAVFNAVDNVITEVSKEFEGVPISSVEEYVLSLVDIPEGGFSADFDGTVTAAGRLWQLLFKEIEPGKVVPKVDLIKREFERAQMSSKIEEKSESAKADKHNTSVDAALEEVKKNKAPATPVDETPVTKRDSVEDDLSFRERLDRLVSGEVFNQ